jgi:NADP-dependent 3-hydroxy acid dehydrogenase YdfG
MLAVGGTSGIGEATARAFVRDTESSRVYLVGRNETQASKIIEELRQINPDGQISFVKCEAARLRSVDEACKLIQEKEEKVNLLFMTAGMMTTKGRDGIHYTSYTQYEG